MSSAANLGKALACLLLIGGTLECDGDEFSLSAGVPVNLEFPDRRELRVPPGWGHRRGWKRTANPLDTIDKHRTGSNQGLSVGCKRAGLEFSGRCRSVFESGSGIGGKVARTLPFLG